MSLIGSVLFTASTVLVAAVFVLLAVLLVCAPGEVIGLRAGWNRREGRLPTSLPYYVDLEGSRGQEEPRSLEESRAQGAPHRPEDRRRLEHPGRPGRPGQPADLRPLEHPGRPGRPGRPEHPREPERFLVYLDGIGKTTPRDTRVARALIGRLGRVLPGTRFVGHVTPYSPLNRALFAHPRLGRWWRLVRRRCRVLLFLRNITQILVASDRRYAGTYREAVAATVVEHLTASGYVRASGAPLILVGYSGGAEAAAGIAPLVQARLEAPPIVVVSIGGILSARGELPGIGHLYHFVSRHDWLERLGRLVFPARWPFARRSGWNLARRHGRVSVHRLDSARHFGRRGYLSSVPVFPDGRSQLDRTLAQVTAVLHDYESHAAPAASPTGR